jgi:Transposase DDE domain
MMMAILKGFRKRLDYDSWLTGNAERLKLDRPRIGRAEWVAPIAEAPNGLRPPVSTTDPDARLFRKGAGKEAELCHMGHLMTENWTDSSSTLGSLRPMVQLNAPLPSTWSMTMAKRAAQWGPTRTMTNRRSAIDARTTRHPGYRISMIKRKQIEEPFGWLKTVGGLRKTRHRGRDLVEWFFVLTATAYNLIRIPTILAAAGWVCLEHGKWPIYEQIFGRYMSRRRYQNTIPWFAAIQTMEILASNDGFSASRSANMTVSWRRSAASCAFGSISAVAEA